MMMMMMMKMAFKQAVKAENV